MIKVNETLVPLEIFDSFDVMGINIQSGLCHVVHMLHVATKVGSETLHENRAIPAVNSIMHAS